MTASGMALHTVLPVWTTFLLAWASAACDSGHVVFRACGSHPEDVNVHNLRISHWIQWFWNNPNSF